MSVGIMNIYAKRGDRVIFANPTFGYEYDQQKAAAHLKVGETYTVEHVDAGRSSSKVYLQERPGIGFNTVLFNDFEDVQEVIEANSWKYETTSRGFGLITFFDRYGEECSIQNSSLATEPCIWLGINHANPRIMNADARRLGIPSEKETGWMDYPVPKEVLMSTRMHLTIEHAIQLIEVLQRFVNTGTIAERKEKVA